MTGRKDSFDSLVEMLSHPDEPVRFRVVGKLMWLEDPRAVGPLLSAMEDESGRIRGMAALAVGHYESREAIPSLLRHLREDPCGHVRAICVNVLGYFGDEMLDALLAALDDPDWNVRGAVCCAVDAWKHRLAIPRMLELLQDDHWSVRLDACETLIDLGVGDERIVRELERLLENPDAVSLREEMTGWHAAFGDTVQHPESGAVIAEMMGIPVESSERRENLAEILQDAQESIGESVGPIERPLTLGELLEKAKGLVAESGTDNG